MHETEGKIRDLNCGVSSFRLEASREWAQMKKNRSEDRNLSLEISMNCELSEGKFSNLLFFGIGFDNVIPFEFLFLIAENRWNIEKIMFLWGLAPFFSLSSRADEKKASLRLKI